MVQPKSAAAVSLASRKTVSMVDQGLTSIQGARQIINAISSRRAVTNLILSHNNLGDDGCEELFQFLCAEKGTKHKIVEILLLSNHIGDRGLSAMSNYLHQNTMLKDLFIQNNNFTGNERATLAFTQALNNSRLELLALSTNHHNSNSFARVFFGTLESSVLREVQFCTSALTYDCIPSIVSYLTSPRCHLQSLRLSGNQLGKRGVVALIENIERANYSLLKLDIFSNAVEAGPAEDDDDGGLQPDTLIKVLARLKAVMDRNSRLKRATERDAFALLRHSRAVLLHSTAPRPDNTRYIPRLPIEIQLYILSFFAPTLSTAQRIRIFNYASNPATLPQLLPPLKSSACVPDPSGFAFGNGGGLGIDFGLGKKSSLCSNGRCLGAGNSVVCRRESERLKYLTEVRCNFYEPEGRDS